MNRDVRVSGVTEHGGAVASAVWSDGVRWSAGSSLLQFSDVTVAASAGNSARGEMAQVVAGRGDSTARDTTLVPRGPATDRRATQLPAVQVEADRTKLADRLSGFEERRAKTLGYFLTEDSIAKREPFQTTDLFKHVPGVSLSNPVHAGDRIHVYSSHELMLFLGGNDPRSGKPCELGVWVDGLPMDSTFDINSIPPGFIHGVEVYHTATTPPQFSAMTTFTNACGALVIWTK
jgi:hypothetical protein